MDRKSLILLGALLLLPLAALLVATFGLPFGGRRPRVFPRREGEEASPPVQAGTRARSAAAVAPGGQSSLQMLRGSAGISVDAQLPPAVSNAPSPPSPPPQAGGAAAVPGWKGRVMQQQAAPPRPAQAPSLPEPAKPQMKLKTEPASKSNFMDFSFNKRKGFEKRAPAPAPTRPPGTARSATPPPPSRKAPTPPRAVKTKDLEGSVQRVSQQTGLAPASRQAASPPREVALPQEEKTVVDPAALQGRPLRTIQSQPREGAPITDAVE